MRREGREEEEREEGEGNGGEEREEEEEEREGEDEKEDEVRRQTKFAFTIRRTISSVPRTLRYPQLSHLSYSTQT